MAWEQVALGFDTALAGLIGLPADAYFEAVLPENVSSPIDPEPALEHAVLRGVQLEQKDAVALAQQLEREPRRSRRRKSLLLSFLGWSFGAFVVLFIVGSAGAGYLLWEASKDLPDYESLARYEATVPLGRLNNPEDIANAVVFLASDDAAMITGSTIEVDGGRCI